ncbi:MAG TPA: BON domain-containing protein [Rubrivivax sp.]
MNPELRHPPHVTNTGINDDVRVTAFSPKRRIWPGVLAAAVLGAGIAAVVVSNYYDSRSMGERLDDTVQATGQTVQTQVDKLEAGAANVARDGAAVGERVAGALDDAGITAAVKTALAADPALSAVKIEVDTDAGVVSLSGPAPDERSRERAAVIAAAPEGVVRVDNRLVVTPTTAPGG